MIVRGTLVELAVEEVLPGRRKKGGSIYLVVEVEDLAVARGRRALLLSPQGRLIWESLYDLIPL